MTIRNTLKIATVAASFVVAGVAAGQAASFTNLGTDNGGPVFNLSGNAIKAPVATQAASSSNGGYTNLGSDRGGVIINLRGGAVDAPVAGSVSPVENSGYRNLGTDRGGVLVPSN